MKKTTRTATLRDGQITISSAEYERLRAEADAGRAATAERKLAAMKATASARPAVDSIVMPINTANYITFQMRRASELVVRLGAIFGAADGAIDGEAASIGEAEAFDFFKRNFGGRDNLDLSIGTLGTAGRLRIQADELAARVTLAQNTESKEA